MKFTILQENLKEALYIVGHIAGKNINLPILNNILIKSDQGNINFTSTDLEIGIINKKRGKVDVAGEFTVDSKILFDYISLLPNKKVELEVVGNEIIINCENYNTKIKGTSSEEFPLIPEIENSETYLVKVKNLKKSLSQVVFATSNSETRMELTGVLFEIFGNELLLVATDSYRLAEKKVILEEKGKKDIKVIVPAKTIQELTRILSNFKDGSALEEENVEIKISENQIKFLISGTELISRLIEGQYPDYKQIIPTKSNTKANISRQELTRVAKMSSLFSKTGINDINLDFPKDKNKIVVSSVMGQAGENITETEALVTGEDNGIVVNYRYLLDCLNNMSSENVTLEISDANTPCIIKAEKDETYIYVIMPIKQ
ncbi:MAG: DNA polymerase III subunit beta [Patescibacteria group bacterium]|jgi:DNA polymerase-3 subunit beta|nr:DNA polymerase III subunit beta [Patescibacteria group bacterium]